MRKTVTILILIMLFAQPNANGSIGDHRGYGDTYLYEMITFENERIKVYNITFGSEVNSTIASFEATISMLNYTDFFNGEYYNLTMLIFLNESTPVLENYEDYGMAVKESYNWNWNNSVKVVYKNDAAISAGNGFPFSTNKERYYPSDSNRNTSVIFNGTKEEMEKAWAIDNPYTIKIVLYYDGEEFPSKPYNLNVHVYLSNFIWLGNENPTSKSELGVGIVMIPISILAGSFLRRKWSYGRKSLVDNKR